MRRFSSKPAELQPLISSQENPSLDLERCKYLMTVRQDLQIRHVLGDVDAGSGRIGHRTTTEAIEERAMIGVASILYFQIRQDLVWHVGLVAPHRHLTVRRGLLSREGARQHTLTGSRTGFTFCGSTTPPRHMTLPAIGCLPSS